MKKAYYFLCVLLSILFLSISPRPVAAATPTLTLSPTSGVPGTTVTIKGNYLPLDPNGNTYTVKIYWDGTSGLTTTPSPITLGKVTSFSATFVVSSTATIGVHNVTAKGAIVINPLLRASTTTVSASAQFTVTKPAIINPLDPIIKDPIIKTPITLPSPTPSPTPVAPSVKTAGAPDVSQSAAVLNGSLGSLGTAKSVQVSFEYGTTVKYGSVTPAQTVTAAGAFSAKISGLTANTTYHFRAKAVGQGTAVGADATFKTQAAPLIIATIPPVTGIVIGEPPLVIVDQQTTPTPTGTATPTPTETIPVETETPPAETPTPEPPEPPPETTEPPVAPEPESNNPPVAPSASASPKATLIVANPVVPADQLSVAGQSNPNPTTQTQAQPEASSPSLPIIAIIVVAVVVIVLIFVVKKLVTG